MLQNYLEMEQSYLKEIHTLLSVYLLPLKQMNDVLTVANHQILCGNLEEIYDFQTKLQREIEDYSKYD